MNCTRWRHGWVWGDRICYIRPMHKPVYKSVPLRSHHGLPLLWLFLEYFLVAQWFSCAPSASVCYYTCITMLLHMHYYGPSPSGCAGTWARRSQSPTINWTAIFPWTYERAALLVFNFSTLCSDLSTFQICAVTLWLLLYSWQQHLQLQQQLPAVAAAAAVAAAGGSRQQWPSEKLTIAKYINRCQGSPLETAL